MFERSVLVLVRLWKRIIFFIIIIGTLFCNGCQSEEPEVKMERHAFLLEEDLIFIADVPSNWRYIMAPADDYYYYKEPGLYETENRYIEFIGVGEKDKDGEDNFFRLIARRGKRWFSDRDRICNSFVFQDGTKGEWEFHIWESKPHYGTGGTVPFYEGNVYELGEKYSIWLSLLGGEYDTNEQVIKEFLMSSCFRDSDLGISQEQDLLKREFITMHIWNKSVRVSFQVPEGVRVKTEEDRCYIYLDENHTFGIYPDYSGEILERSGDFHYYLNVEDFEETVYEIPSKYSGKDYYFPNHHLLIWNVNKDEVKLQECVKKIVQSMRFE